MKTFPICQAVAFDDAHTCYGCLHKYSAEEEQAEHFAFAPLHAKTNIRALDPINPGIKNVQEFSTIDSPIASIASGENKVKLISNSSKAAENPDEVQLTNPSNNNTHDIKADVGISLTSNQLLVLHTSESKECSEDESTLSSSNESSSEDLQDAAHDPGSAISNTVNNRSDVEEKNKSNRLSLPEDSDESQEPSNSYTWEYPLYPPGFRINFMPSHVEDGIFSWNCEVELIS